MAKNRNRSAKPSETSTNSWFLVVVAAAIAYFAYNGGMTPDEPAPFVVDDGNEKVVFVVDPSPDVQGNYTPGQKEALYSEDPGGVRDYLDKTGAEFVILDMNKSPDGERSWVREGYAKWREKGGGKHPYILIGGAGGGGTHGELPPTKTAAEALALVKKYGKK